jgi:serine protease inhibitor
LTKGITLVDAIYFKQAWQNPFSVRGDEKRRFSSITGDHDQGRDHAPARLFSSGIPTWLPRDTPKPYLRRTLSMVIVLPDDVDGATALVPQLDASEVFALFGALRQGHETNTYLSLPRFRIRFATKLKNSFQRLGIARPFDEDHAERPRGRRFIQAHQIEQR